MSALGWHGPQEKEIMKNLRFEQHEMQESVTGRKYNDIMGTSNPRYHEN